VRYVFSHPVSLSLFFLNGFLHTLFYTPSFWFGTKYIISGEATYSINETEFYNNTIQTLFYKYKLKLIDALTAEEIGAFTDIKSYQGNINMETIHYLAKELITELSGKIPQLFLKTSMDKDTLTFIITGIDDFEKNLEKISGIKSLTNVQGYGDRVKYKLRYDGNLSVLMNRLKEFGYSVERYQNEYHLKKIASEVMVEIHNCSFSDLKIIKNTFPDSQSINFSNGIIMFLLEGEMFSIAEEIDNQNYSIIEMTDKKITAQKGE